MEAKKRTQLEALTKKKKILFDLKLTNSKDSSSNAIKQNAINHGSLKNPISISKTSGPQSQTQSQDQLKHSLEGLKVKRSQLREKLHNYQIEFTKNHNRKIRYHKDIEPVEEEYKRYKEIKNEIARIESLLQ